MKATWRLSPSCTSLRWRTSKRVHTTHTTETMHRYLILTLLTSFHRYCYVTPAGLPSIEVVQAGNATYHKAEEMILQHQPSMSGEIFDELKDKVSKSDEQNASEALTETVAPKFTELSEFGDKSVGGRIIFATDDYFAAAENLIEDSEPVNIKDKLTEYGIWMDGWETRRKRIPGHDWCIIQLAASCSIQGILVDTAYFTGNFAPRISVQGGNLTEKDKSLAPHRKGKIGTSSSSDEIKQISQLRTDEWPELIRMTNLKPGTERTRMNYFSVTSNDIFSSIRVNIYPDAGIARLRVFGIGAPDSSMLNGVFDLIGMENGGYIVSYSNAYFGHPKNLIKIGRATKAGDGWETVRRLDRPPILKEDSNGSLIVRGCEWTIIEMSCTGIVTEIVIDLLYFMGNAPYSFKIEGTVSNSDETLTASKWVTILNKQKLRSGNDGDKEDTHIYKADQFQSAGPFNYVKITIYPDGGLSRLRLLGRKAK